VGTAAPHDAHFEQVAPKMDVALIHAAMADLAAAAAAAEPPIALFAIDGTLLNLMRWGRVVNDNDVDVGVVAAGAAAGNATAHYHALVRALAASGFLYPVTDRQLRRLYHPYKDPKRGGCRIRKQFMQCRHLNGVEVDVFGPETVFSDLTRLTAADVLPTAPCRLLGGAFPCPRRPLRALKAFTMDLAAPGDRAKKAWYEFAGCAMLPRRATEHTAAHVRSVLRSVGALARCGHPSLLADKEDPACVRMMHNVGITG
jgi:hypothetical protein